MYRRKINIIGIFIFLFLTFLSFNVHAKEINISNLEVNSILLKDGSLNIEETIDFKMKGEFNGVYRSIDTKFSGGVENINVKEISPSGEIQLNEVPQGKEGQSAVYEISNSGTIYKLKIYSPSRDENKKFKISYQLKNVAKKYNDVGELQYRFWSDASETKIDKFNINLALDNKHEGNSIDIFAKGPLEEIKASIIDSNNFNIKGEKVNEKTPIEGRFLFKKEAIALSNNVINENGLDRIVEQEKSYAKAVKDEKQNKESMRKTGNVIGVGAIGLNLVLGTVIFKVKKRKEESFEFDFFPEENTPAVASKLYRNVIDEKCLLSTVLDLVRKKYLYIKKLDKDDYAIVKVKTEDKELLSHEAFIIKWFVNYIGDGLKVRLKEIENYSKDNKKDFFDAFCGWKKMVKEEFDKKGYYDKKSRELSGIFIGICIIEMLIMIICLANGSMTALIGLLTGISAMMYSFSLRNKRSSYGEIQFRKLKRFKEYLEKNSFVKEDISSLDNIDKYLVYAVALGINNKIFEKFNINTKNNTNRDDSYYDSCLYWYYALNMDDDNNAIQHSINNCCNHSSGVDGGSFSSGDSGGCAGGGDAGGF